MEQSSFLHQIQLLQLTDTAKAGRMGNCGGNAGAGYRNWFTFSFRNEQIEQNVPARLAEQFGIFEDVRTLPPLRVAFPGHLGIDFPALFQIGVFIL